MSRDDHNEAAETVQVVYCSASQHRELPEHVCIRSTPRPSTAMCEHIYTVDKSRLGNFVGHLTPQEMQRLDIGIMVALDIGGGTEPENLRGGGSLFSVGNFPKHCRGDQGPGGVGVSVQDRGLCVGEEKRQERDQLLGHGSLHPRQRGGVPAGRFAWV